MLIGVARCYQVVLGVAFNHYSAPPKYPLLPLLIQMIFSNDISSYPGQYPSHLTFLRNQTLPGKENEEHLTPSMVCYLLTKYLWFTQY